MRIAIKINPVELAKLKGLKLVPGMPARILSSHLLKPLLTRCSGR